MIRRLACWLTATLLANTLSLSGTAFSIGYPEQEISALPENGSAASTVGTTTAAPVPLPEAVLLANHLLKEEDTPDLASSKLRGGLWLSGDLTEGLARLRWIIGAENGQFLNLGREGRLNVDAAKLARAAGADDFDSGEAALQLAGYISANEGLSLLLQITLSSHRYLLHIGPRAPTAAGEVEIVSIANLDNNFDSRINPRRRMGLKLGCESPPSGIDSVVALNPSTRWFNEVTRNLVPVGEITFHELAEAYTKIEFGFEYLSQGSCPGAHNIAIGREERLLSQRPMYDPRGTRTSYFVLTASQPLPPRHLR